MRFIHFMSAGLAALMAGTAFSQVTAVTPESAARDAPQAYVKAINSNDLAVRPWDAAYLKAYHTHWDKPLQEFVHSGDWAFERFAYTSTDLQAAAGAPVVATGWGSDLPSPGSR